MIGLLDRGIVDLLERYSRLAWITGDRILLPVELSVITLAVPTHLGFLRGHTVLHRAQVACHVLLLHPGAREGMRIRRRSGHARRRELIGHSLRANVIRDFASERPAIGRDCIAEAHELLASLLQYDVSRVRPSYFHLYGVKVGLACHLMLSTVCFNRVRRIAGRTGVF